MKVIVIGLGSMGKRRIRLIKQYRSDIEIVGIDTREDRRQEVQDIYGMKTFETLSKCHSDASAAFICTAPLSHPTLITECLTLGLHVFCELNLIATDYQKNIELARDKDLKLFLSSTMLYREEVTYIGKRVAQSKTLPNYMYHVGQYLPDWHPWEDYNEFFVGDKKSNGCREFLAIELPWIQKVFGEIQNVTVRKSKNSHLRILYDDNYMLLLEHKSGIKGMMAVDVISRKAVRNLEVFGEELHLSWDGSATGLFDYDFNAKTDKPVSLYTSVDHLAGYNNSIVENAYLKEVQTFFDTINGMPKEIYGFEEDIRTIKWIDVIEE